MIIALAKYLKLAAARGISTVRARAMGLPLSMLSARASSSRRCSIRSAMRCNRAERFSMGVAAQAGAARVAAATAKATSCLSESGNWL